MKRLFIILNFILVGVILVFLYFQYYSENINIECDYDSSPQKLIEIIESESPKVFDHDVVALFIFNEIPFLSDLENIQKLFLKNKNIASFYALFTKKFKSKNDIKFPHGFFPNIQFNCHRFNKNDNYCLILKNKRVIHAEKQFKVFDINFLIKKNIENKIHLDNISVEALRKRISEKINQKPFNLFDIKEEKMLPIEDIPDFDKIHFYHANCSVCQIKSMISNLKVDEFLNNKKIIIIFSVLANSAELKSIIDSNSKELRIYVDLEDYFDLLSVISDEKKMPIIINKNEIRRCYEN